MVCSEGRGQFKVFSLSEFAWMEATSPSASSPSANEQEVTSLNDLPIQQSLLLSDSLKGLRSMRSQLYSAAEYFELSYINDDQKEIVTRTLKDYAIKAIVNAVDHLGSVSYKVNSLLDEEADGVSVAEFEISCIEQRIRMCQECIDQEGLSQQSLLIRPPKYQKHYIVQGESMADSGTMQKHQGFYQPKANSKLKQHPSATRHRPSPIRNVDSPSASPSPSTREHSLLPSHKTRSTSPLPQFEKVSHKERRATSPLRASNPLTCARSASNRPPIPNSSKQYPLESQNSLPICLHAERNTHKEFERNPTKRRGFLRTLLMRNGSWTDESLYSYLDEY